MRLRNFISAFLIVAYGIAMALMGYLGRHFYTHTEIMVLITLVAAFIAVPAFLAIWNLNVSMREGQQAEKRKREELDSVLRDMSNADLMALKRRLMDVAPGDSFVVDEEGEFLKDKLQ
jgi:ABC-type protease/lipase transport system fused ATPase/permease subunit